MTQRSRTAGDLLRLWRQRRRHSQLSLALHADVSARHLSFIETGRARPSREMLLGLAERLEIPLRDRNVLLLAAGYAPEYRETRLDDPALRAARDAVTMVLGALEPYPALAVDRQWTIVASNRATAPLLEGAAPELLRPPVNALRLSLHPHGLAPRITNLAEWRRHILERLRRDVEISGDGALVALEQELRSYGTPDHPEEEPATAWAHTDVVVPLRLRTPRGVLSFASTTTVFGTAVDVTLAELAIEAFLPADRETAELLGTPRLAAGAPAC